MCRYLNPDPSILETAEPALKKLKAEFPLEKNGESVKRERNEREDREDGGQEESLLAG